MSVCVWVCLRHQVQGSKGGPRGAKQSPIVFEASHWPSDHMIRSWPLIGHWPIYLNDSRILNKNLHNTRIFNKKMQL